MDRCRPLEIWQVVNEGQQPFICDVQGGELRRLPLFLLLIAGSLSVFALTFLGLRQLLPLLLVALSRLACDHDSLCCCADIIFQR